MRKPDELGSDGTSVMDHRRFTNTALPVFSGAECWFQHFHIVEAIVKSNGWPEETAALQLFAHLTGEALNVALEKRESWTGLVGGLAAYYQSPSRLAGLRRRFESAFRQPGLQSQSVLLRCYRRRLFLLRIFGIYVPSMCIIWRISTFSICIYVLSHQYIGHGVLKEKAFRVYF